MNRLTRIVAAGTALALGATGLTGCDFTDGFDDDPNAATSAPPNLLLTGGQVGQIVVQESDLARIAGIFAAQFTGSDRQYSAVERAGVGSGDFSGSWTDIYQETAAQLGLAIEGFEAANNRTGAGVAKMHQALAFGTATALFGDIPYSQALDADIDNPPLDPQAEVYAGVIAQLQSAISDLESGIGSAAGDIFIGDNLEAAYTLLARYNLHIGNYSAALAAAQNGISSTENNLRVPHGTSRSNDANVYYMFVVVERDGYLTADNSFALDLLLEDDELSDESGRANFYFFPGEDGDGLPASSGAELNTGDDGAYAIDADYAFVTFRENQLILAEAALLTGDEDTALDALNSVRQQNEVDFGDGDEDLEYEDFDADDFENGNALLREILTEKYLSLIGQIEAFNDIRRTDNFIGIPGKNNGSVPQRFLYPENERNANESLPGVIPGLDQETPVNASIAYTGI